MTRSVKRLLLICSVCLAWMVDSLHPLWKYLTHTQAILASIIGVLGITAGMLFLETLYKRKEEVKLQWFLVLFLALVTAFAFLYPLSLKHTINIGSDREDALRVELIALQHHQYPYDARTFLGNPPTPLPGAVVLAAPFFQIGHIAWQNLFWYALFFAFTLHFFTNRATGLFFLTIFLLLAPGNLSDFTSGGDYLTNFFYLAIAVTLFVRSLHRSWAFALPVAVFLGVALSSRIIYVVMLLPLLALALQRATRSRVFSLFSVTFLTSALITLPIFVPKPIPRLLLQLKQNSGKLHFISAAFHPEWTLPLIACLVALLSFRVRMDLPRLFLTFGAASLVMLGPSVITSVLHSGGYSAFYLTVSSLSLSLWLLHEYEKLHKLTCMNAASPDSGT